MCKLEGDDESMSDEDLDTFLVLESEGLVRRVKSDQDEKVSQSFIPFDNEDVEQHYGTCSRQHHMLQILFQNRHQR